MIRYTWLAKESPPILHLGRRNAEVTPRSLDASTS